MSDLAKLVDDLSSIEPLEADELAALLERKWGIPASQAIAFLRARPRENEPVDDTADNLHDLPTEHWLIAEGVSLMTEAKALADSLDDTLDYVRSRCDAVRKAA